MTVQTRANLKTDINSNLASGTDITATELRTEFTDVVDSMIMSEDIDTKAELEAIVGASLQEEPTEGAFANGDKTKLDGIEASADVTDETNVIAALSGATITDLGTPASGDWILLQDASDADNLKKADFTHFTGGSGNSWGDAVDSDILPTGASDTYDLGSSAATFAQGYISDLFIDSILITERADHVNIPAAGAAELWVSNGTQQELMFTDDTGTDRQVLTGSALSDPGADRIVFWDDSANTGAFLTAGNGLDITGTTLTVAVEDLSHNITTDVDNYTLVIGDQNGVVLMSSGSANTLTIPTNASVAFPTGTKIEVWSTGAGTTSIAGDTGVTLQGNGGSASAGSCDIQTQYGGATLTKIATDTWIVGGDIDAVA